MKEFKKDFLADDIKYAAKQNFIGIGIIIVTAIVFLILMGISIEMGITGLTVILYLILIVITLYVVLKFKAKGLNRIVKEQKKNNVKITALSMLRVTLNFILAWVVLGMFFVVISFILIIIAQLSKIFVVLGLIIGIIIFLGFLLMLFVTIYPFYIYPLVTGKWNFNPFVGNFKKNIWKVLLYEVSYAIISILMFAITVIPIIGGLGLIFCMVFISAYNYKILIRLVPTNNINL